MKQRQAPTHTRARSPSSFGFNWGFAAAFALGTLVWTGRPARADEVDDAA